MFGLAEDEVPEALRERNAEPAVKPDDSAAAQELRELLAPVRQYEILNPEHLRLASEVFVIEQTCGNGHTVERDAPPAACETSSCKSKTFAQTERLDRHWYEVNFAFTDYDVHRRKVWEHVEHWATMVTAEMRRHHPNADFSGDWFYTHREYLEVGMMAPETKSQLREFLAFYLREPRPERVTPAVVDGTMLGALTLVATALWRKRFDRILKEQTEKKDESSTGALGTASGTGPSTLS